MAQCPFCTQIYKSDHGVRVHLPKCPKRNQMMRTQMMTESAPPPPKRARTVGDDETGEMQEGTQSWWNSGEQAEPGPSDEQQTTYLQQETRSSGRTRKVPVKFEEYEISSMSAVIKGSRGVAMAPLSALATPAAAPATPATVPGTPVPVAVPATPTTLPGTPVTVPGTPAVSVADVPSPPPLPIIERFYYKTEPNSVGIYRIYDSSEPSLNPDVHATISQFVDAPTLMQQGKEVPTADQIEKSMGVPPEHPEVEPPNLGPFANVSTVAQTIVRMFGYPLKIAL
ncbi:hypothetical protein V5O48_018350 [Marasmius crinis-equi]|uniref:Uncharacterized protein n=1 Tax=Marasmius crinis-equi TaxID=585013 RepID=A0ABR3ELJ9_9AGAR